MSAVSHERPNGLPASQMENLFRHAGVLSDELHASKNQRARATAIGNFLSRHVNREVEIEVNGRSGRAKLCVVTGRSRSKLYFFEIKWDDAIDIPSVPALTLAPDAGRCPAASTPEVAGASADEGSPPGLPADLPTVPSGGNGEEW